jgi:hypothetical protein
VTQQGVGREFWQRKKKWVCLKMMGYISNFMENLQADIDTPIYIGKMMRN